jgi:hypothetical protein
MDYDERTCIIMVEIGGAAGLKISLTQTSTWSNNRFAFVSWDYPSPFSPAEGTANTLRLLFFRIPSLQIVPLNHDLF